MAPGSHHRRDPLCTERDRHLIKVVSDPQRGENSLYTLHVSCNQHYHARYLEHGMFIKEVQF